MEPTSPADDGEQERRVPWAPVAVFATIGVLVAADLVTDVRSGTEIGHAAVELFVFALAGGGAALLWRAARRARREARRLRQDLTRALAESEHFRKESREALEGLGVAIDRQFERWALTPAEREVALLLLKGLSLKEVADARSTSERTARQQALGVYRKSGLSGRAELAAFFLEDLLLPSR
ncbi:MAG: LuxR family transcriptional regulator [Deltaproteobacteria bacterium]|nr:LuxR family transcriptional regulator [Deltaproteobacteria bacterium]